MSDPIRETGFPILGFITILCLKFRALFKVSNEDDIRNTVVPRSKDQNLIELLRV